MTPRLVAALMGVAAVIGACVIAEPPAELPEVPSRGPTIRTMDLTPPSGIITKWPTKFFVPVELSDARETFYLAAFIDYNPITGEGLADAPTRSTLNGSTSRVRVIELEITAPTTVGCHIVEVVVARSLQDITGSTGRLSHAPASGDGDIVNWYYSANGDPSGCTQIDAGLTPLDASVP